MRRGYHIEIGDAFDDDWDNHKYIYVAIYIEPKVVKELAKSNWESFIDMRLSDAKSRLLKHFKKVKDKQ